MDRYYLILPFTTIQPDAINEAPANIVMILMINSANDRLKRKDGYPLQNDKSLKRLLLCQISRHR